jgi:hypothetical protein
VEDEAVGMSIDVAGCDTWREVEGREGLRVDGCSRGVLVCICQGNSW